MYYEIFIDVLFVMNFLIDYFLLRLVNRLLGGSATLRRSLLGAGVGAGAICLLALRPCSRILNTILVHVVIDTLMVRFGCNLKTIRKLLKGVLLLYGAAFLLGGCMQLLSRYTGSRGIWIVLLSGAVSYLFLAAGMRVFARSEKQADRIYKVWLYANGKCREGTAMIDTGNNLMDPFNGKPVSIGTSGFLEGLLGKDMLDRLDWSGQRLLDGADFGSMQPHLVPFTSLGCGQGVMLTVTLDYLYLEGRSIHKVIRRPVIAVSRENDRFLKDYQILLHPNLIDS